MIPNPEERKILRQAAAKRRAEDAKKNRKILFKAAIAVLIVVSLRKKRETAADFALLERYVVESFEEFTDRRLLIDHIRTLVEQKDERTQAVFRLRTEGYSYAEIGERVGISENSARVMEHRLRLWLKKALKEEELQ